MAEPFQSGNNQAFSQAMGEVFVESRQPDPEEENVNKTAGDALLDFKQADGFSLKGFSIEAYLEDEPGRVFDMAVEMLKSKDQREDEDAARAADHASFQTTISGLCSDKPWNWRRWRVAVFTEGNQFKALFISLVCINGILIGVEADHGHNDNLWNAIEAGFLSLFVIELAIKYFGFGYLFFTDSWNVFDFAIVGISITELVLTMGLGRESSSGLSTFRLLRIFRIIRVIGFVARLNMLVQAFIIAMRSVIWVGVLLIMCVYIFAIMAQGFFKDVNSHYFGTVPRSMATLFQMLTGDAWCSGIAWPIGMQYMAAWAFFIVFVLLGGFGLLNLLTGVFIEALMEITKMNDLDAQAGMAKQRRSLITTVAGAFRQTDADAGGTLDQDELPEMLQLLEDWSEMLEYVGLDPKKMTRACLIADYSHEGRSYWEVTDADGNTMVSVHHDRFRPVPDNAIANGWKRLAGGDEGVMEGEIVECLTSMDDPFTNADYFAVRKDLRLYLKDTVNTVDDVDWGLKQRLREAMSLCGGDRKWEAAPMPEKEVVDSDSEEEAEEGGAVEQVGDEIPYEDLLAMGAQIGATTAAVDVTGDSEEAKQLLRVSRQLFDRYDLDQSGTINSQHELRMLVTNMIYTVGMSPDRTARVMKKLDAVPAHINMNHDAFMVWWEAAQEE